MDFLTTARLLMDLRKRAPHARYSFDENGICTIQFSVDEDVPAMFDQAAKMFEPVD